MSIQTLFAEPAALPTVPKVVQQLIQSFEREDVSVDEIAEQITSDPVISAKTLRLANSAYFHMSRQISTVPDSLRMLGFVMVRNLVLGLGVVGAFKHVKGLDLAQFWRHSLNTACAARWLAHATDRNSDLAFTVGLMQGLGHLVMHAVLKDKLAPLNKQCHPLAPERADAEQAALGYHHGEVAAELARRWKFPEAMAQTLAEVARPQGTPDADSVTGIVHVAAWWATIEALRLPQDSVEASRPTALFDALNLSLAWDQPHPLLSMTQHGERQQLPDFAELSGGMETMIH